MNAIYKLHCLIRIAIMTRKIHKLEKRLNNIQSDCHSAILSSENFKEVRNSQIDFLKTLRKERY